MALLRSLGRSLVLFGAAAASACASGDPGEEVEQDPPVIGGGEPTVEAVRITEKSLTKVGGDVSSASRLYVRNFDTELGLNSLDDFDVRQVREGRDRLHHVRMTQLHDGLPVWGAGLVVHSDGNTFLGLSGTVAKHLGRLDRTIVVSAEDALAIARADFASTSKDPSLELVTSRESVQLLVYPRDGRNASVAWHVVFFSELQADLNPALSNYFIEAKSGEVIGHFNAIHTLEQASGPGGNPKVARSWVQELDVEPQTTVFAMNTARLRTSNMNNGTAGSGTIVTGPLDPIGDAPINDAHGFAEQTLNMMSEWYGHNSIDDNGFIIRSRVHYGFSFENAFWDGVQMTYGDGATIFYPLSGDVDVVGHEISHGFTTFHSNLIYAEQSGGNNEASSDIAGTIVEHFDEGDAADFDIGTDIFRADAALRFMCDPTADGISIDHASDFQPGMDVHFSSGVMNKAFCLAANRLATGTAQGPATQASVRRAGEAWYEANASFWTESSNFESACDGVLVAASTLGFSDQERAFISQSWQDVGVFCDGVIPPVPCDETLTAASGTITSPNFPNNYPNNFSRTWCIEPASGNPATLVFSAFNTEANFDFVRIRDANGATISNTSGVTAPAAATSTRLQVTFTTDFSVVRTGWSASWTTATPNQPPVAAITSPADGATVSGAVPVAATATDPDGTVARVSFSLPDGTTVDDTTAPYEVTWDSTTVSDGTHEVSAQAFDNLGAGSEVAAISVEVANGGGCLDGTFPAADVPIAIPDNNTTGVRSFVDVDGTGAIGSLALSLDITHTFRGDLIVTLRSPSGTTFVVSRRSGGAADDLVIDNLVIPNFNGETAAGRWQLRVRDLHANDVGTLNSWSLDVVGDCGAEIWSGAAEPNMATVDNGTACTSLTVDGDGDAGGALLSISGQHDWRSILRGTLAHAGVEVEAFPTSTFPPQAGAFSFVDRPVAGLTGSAAGAWTLCLVDTDGFDDSGVLASWSVHN